ncbi:hypothetical protein IW144_004319, partial [Coemansia sp. RSA 522]
SGVCADLNDLGLAYYDDGTDTCVTKYTPEEPYNANSDTCNTIKKMKVDLKEINVICKD